jgi:hypothetical protein
MKSKASIPDLLASGPSRRVLVLAVLSLALPTCSKGTPELPTPRPVVIRTGARLFADPERMKVIDAWFRPQMENITNDPSFMIEAVPRDTPSYPWESLLLVADTAKIGVQAGFDDAARIFELYAHYHLMKEKGRIAEFLPGGENLEGFSFERAVLSRVADAWFLGRAVYQAVAFDPLEEILYANENGYLDAMILTARGDEFKEERQAWLKEAPEALERYRAWFVETFDREPPGLGGPE